MEIIINFSCLPVFRNVLDYFDSYLFPCISEGGRGREGGRRWGEREEREEEREIMKVMNSTHKLNSMQHE